MLYVCIPVYNEAETIGLVLWRLRKVFQEHSREYEVIVYDDGSTDSTAETLAPYADILPLTVIGGKQHEGYAKALDGLCRAAANRTRYPRRDALVLMQGDFTDSPDRIPDLLKRFDGGADIVVGERDELPSAPKEVRRLRWASKWLAKPLTVSGVTDPFGAVRLFRISAIRDAMKKGGDVPLVTGTGWAANADLLLRIAPFARRIETIPLSQRFDLRHRETRIKPWADAMALFKFGRSAKSRVNPAQTPAS